MNWSTLISWLRRDYVSKYTDDYKLQVLLGYCTIYIFMQTFMIPGTIVMSLLAGSLFGVAQGMALVVFTASAGASCCYLLSKLIGRPLAMWLWGDKLHYFTREVSLGVSNSIRCRLHASTTSGLVLIGWRGDGCWLVHAIAQRIVRSL